MLQRPAMRDEVEHGFNILAGRTFGVIGLQLLDAADIKSAAFGITTNEDMGSTGAAIVLGNFEGFLQVLRRAPFLAKLDSLVKSRG